MEKQHCFKKANTLHHATPRYILLIQLLLGISSINDSVAAPDRTCLSRNLFFTNGYYIGGYPIDGSAGETLTVERVLDDNRVVTDANSRVDRYQFPPQEDGFGAFTCVFYPQEVRITTVLLSDNGDVTPESPTVTVSVGEDVTLRMNQLFTGSSTELRWKHNGDDVTAWNGLSNVALTNVRGSNAGIYECYRAGNYDQQRHAIMKLIVRECPARKWGPLCSGDCPFCRNGGICDDKTGECICTPGFSGDFCQTLNGYNHFGLDGTIRCTYDPNRDEAEACRGYLMCLPDPLGCTCATGLTALDCRQDCSNGYFGAGCKHECHCAGGVACDKGHGRCPSGVACAAGYTGENCQICPDGLFGSDCRHACHCEEDKACNKENGSCPDGVQCSAGYRGENCQNVCPTGQIGKYTDSCVSCLVPVYVSTPTRSKNNTNTLEWSQAYSRCPVSEYKVQSKLLNKEQCQTVDEEFTNLTSVTPRVDSYDLSAADSSLHAYSTYKFRVIAINEAGLLEYPEFEIEYTTPEKAPTASPANVRTSTIEINRLSFVWDEVPCGYRGGSNLMYRCKLTSGPGNVVLTKEVTDLAVNIQNLPPCTLYSFEVAAKDVRIGELGPYSASLPVATGTKAHGPVNSLAVATDTSGSSTQMTVIWSSPDTSQNPCSLCYVVEYELTKWGQCGPVASPQRVAVANQTTTSATITGLEAYSTYKVYVRTWNAAGFSEEKEDETNTPSRAPSGPPGNVQLDAKTRYSILFSWNEIPCGRRNGQVTEYQIQYRVLGKPYIIGFTPDDSYTSDTRPFVTMEYNISDLEPSTTYEIRLAGVNDAGRGLWAKAELSTSVETELEPPAKPSYDTSKITSSSVTISLNLPSTSPYITGVQVGVRQAPTAVKRAASESKQLRSMDTAPHYVSGELSKGDLPETFTVGDGKTYGGFDNKPLVSGTEYDIFIGSVSRISDAEFFVVWGEPLRVKVKSSGLDGSTVTIAVLSVLCIALVITLSVCGVKIRMKRRARRNQTNNLVQEMDEIGGKVTDSPQKEIPSVYEDVGLPPWAAKWEVIWTNLTIDDQILGRGNFGEVRSGTVTSGEKATKSAIKVLKGNASARDREDFMTEFRTMTNIGPHPNVVSLLGACQHDEVLYVALEYLPNGDLRNYLRQARSSCRTEDALSPAKMVKLALDVASGMKHLAMSGVIHRDLAARNILLGHGFVAKVCDFGLSRGEDVYVQESTRRVPTRWLAIESLTHRTYTTKSDVWSFGILLWEIASVGGTPYPDVKTQSLAALLVDGYRMPKPSNCDDEIYDVMLQCWQDDPEKRPSFAELVSILSSMDQNKGEHIYMSVDRTHYENFSVIRPALDDN